MRELVRRSDETLNGMHGVVGQQIAGAREDGPWQGMREPLEGLRRLRNLLEGGTVRWGEIKPSAEGLPKHRIRQPPEVAKEARPGSLRLRGAREPPSLRAYKEVLQHAKHDAGLPDGASPQEGELWRF